MISTHVGGQAFDLDVPPDHSISVSSFTFESQIQQLPSCTYETRQISARHPRGHTPPTRIPRAPSDPIKYSKVAVSTSAVAFPSTKVVIDAITELSFWRRAVRPFPTSTATPYLARWLRRTPSKRSWPRHAPFACQRLALGRISHAC